MNPIREALKQAREHVKEAERLSMEEYIKQQDDQIQRVLVGIAMALTALDEEPENMGASVSELKDWNDNELVCK